MAQILLVEDNPIISSQLRALLETDGDSVVECSEVATAIEMIEGEAHFDIAMVDYWLVGETAEPVLATLRAKRPDVCVVLITGGHDKISVETTRWLGATEGMHGFLQKPFSRADIRRLFKKLGF